jgi:hypothetical protein
VFFSACAGGVEGKRDDAAITFRLYIRPKAFTVLDHVPRVFVEARTKAK